MTKRSFILICAAVLLLLAPAHGSRLTQRTFSSANKFSTQGVAPEAAKLHYECELGEKVNAVVNLDDESHVVNVQCSPDHANVRVSMRDGGALQVELGDLVVSQRWCRGVQSMLSMRQVKSIQRQGAVVHLTTTGMALNTVFRNMNTSFATPQPAARIARKAREAEVQFHIHIHLKHIVTKAWHAVKAAASAIVNTVKTVAEAVLGEINVDKTMGPFLDIGWNMNKSNIPLFSDDGLDVQCVGCYAHFDGISVVANLHMHEYHMQDGSELYAHTGAEVNARLQATINKNYNGKQDKTIAYIMHPHLYVIMLGPIPVPLVISIPILGGYSFSSSDGLTAWIQWTLSASLDAGIQWQGGDLKPLKTFTHNTNLNAGFTDHVQLTATGYVGPALKVMLGDMIGFQIGVLPTATLTIDQDHQGTDKTCSYNIGGEIEIPITGHLDLFVYKKDYDWGTSILKLGGETHSCEKALHKRVANVQEANKEVGSISLSSSGVANVSTITSGVGAITGLCSNGMTCGTYGVCVRGQCRCAAGWAGPNCELRVAVSSKCSENVTIATADDVPYCRHLTNKTLCLSKDQIAKMDELAFSRAKDAYAMSTFPCFQRSLALQCALLLPEVDAQLNVDPVCMDQCVQFYDECGLAMVNSEARCYLDAETSNMRQIQPSAVQGGKCAPITPPTSCVPAVATEMEACAHLVGQQLMLYTNPFNSLEEADLIVRMTLNETNATGLCLQTAIASLCHNLMPPCSSQSSKPVGMCPGTCQAILGQCAEFTQDEVNAFCATPQVHFVAPEAGQCTTVNTKMVAQTALAVEMNRIPQPTGINKVAVGVAAGCAGLALLALIGMVVYTLRRRGASASTSSTLPEDMEVALTSAEH